MAGPFFAHNPYGKGRMMADPAVTDSTPGQETFAAEPQQAPAEADPGEWERAERQLRACRMAVAHMHDEDVSRRQVDAARDIVTAAFRHSPDAIYARQTPMTHVLSEACRVLRDFLGQDKAAKDPDFFGWRDPVAVALRVVGTEPSRVPVDGRLRKVASEFLADFLKRATKAAKETE